MNPWGFLKTYCFFFFCLLFICQEGLAASSQMNLRAVTFHELPGWKEDNLNGALLAFKQSCREMMTRHDDETKVKGEPLRPLQEWREVCLKAAKMNAHDEKSVRDFFEKRFIPYAVTADGHHEGLFTGYYLPLIHASEKPSKAFSVPIYALPEDLVKVDLGTLKSDLQGKTLVGIVKDNTLFPYPDRKTINRDKFNLHTKVLMWADDPIDLYFAHVQGSAEVELPDGKRLLIGYAGNNGRKYTAIGKVLVDKHELTREEVSMQSIRLWLRKHPTQVDALFNQNESYVFFKILPDQHPLGTEKVPLTPERSLAIDNHYIPFGAPLWLSTSIPDKTYHVNGKSKLLRRLFIAQDTGGAIKGAVRGDIYWGAGDKAEYIAGYMKNPGRYWLLLPK